MKDKLSDRLWRLNNLYYITNERGEKVRFKLNAVQESLYWDLWYSNIILKSRQHGITTFVCIFFLDAALFNSNIRAGIIAHNREDAEAFFSDKIKFAYDNLPESLKAVRPADTSNTRELMFSNNSAIRVGTSMRSATLQYLHISEFGKICKKYPDKAKEIVTGSLNTVHAGQMVIIESTAEGNEGYFFDYCQAAETKAMTGAKLTPLDMKFFFFGWHNDLRNQLDPEGVIIPQPLEDYFNTLEQSHGIQLLPEQKAWYAKKWEIQGDEMKREHPSTAREAFEARIEGTYFSSQLTRANKESRITTFPIEDAIPIDTWWDLGMNDTMVIWFTQTVRREVRIVDYYENSGEGLAHYKDILDKKGYKYGTHHAPHDIEVRELGTGKSRKEVAQKLGINFEVVTKLPKEDQIAAARDFIQYCWFHDPRCSQGIKALENYRKEWDDKNGCYKNKPLHNWASNAADAFMILAVGHRFKTSGDVFSPKREYKARAA